jgi:hypothetical protein
MRGKAFQGVSIKSSIFFVEEGMALTREAVKQPPKREEWRDARRIGEAGASRSQRYQDEVWRPYLSSAVVSLIPPGAASPSRAK